MKTKRILSFAGLMIIAGFIIFAIGFSQLGWDWTELDDAEYYAQTLDLNDQVFGGETQIDILDAKIDSFKIIIENGDEFKIDYYTSEKSEVKINYVTRGDKKALEFSLTERWQKMMFTMFNGFKKSQLTIRVTVPAGVELNLDVPSATLNSSNIIFSKVAVKGGSSNIIFADFACDSFSFSGGSADVRLDRVKCGDVNISSSSGDARLTSCETGNITFSGSSAKLILDTVTAGDIIANGSSSNFQFSKVNANSVKIDGSSTDSFINNSQIADFITANGSSSDVHIISSSAKSFTGDGSSTDVFLSDGAFESVKFTGNSSKVVTDMPIDCDKFDFKGSSSNFIITVFGTKEDFATINMSGSSSSFRLNDEKFEGSYSGTGTKSLIMSGNSSKCRLSFAAKI